MSPICAGTNVIFIVCTNILCQLIVLKINWYSGESLEMFVSVVLILWIVVAISNKWKDNWET